MNEIFFTMQQNAWMDTEVMKKYINLLPTQTEMNIFIMDQFKVPEGYTDSLQPLDVSVMKSFESGMGALFNVKYKLSN